MKLISQFKNRFNNITYCTYECNTGIKVLHLNNPATIDFDFAIIFNAGSSYEDMEKVPHGTAHFLEHMLLNPNGIYKDKEEIDRFEQGNKERPAIYSNAYTSRKNIYFTCHSNGKGYLRSLERLENILIFSKKEFSKQMEKERGVILAEKSRKLKKEKDSYLMSLEFLFKDISPEFAYDVLGESEDINSITVDSLETYFKNRFKSEGCVLAVQSKGELKKDVIDKLEGISEKIQKGNPKQFRKVQMGNIFKVGGFQEERMNGFSLSFIYFDKTRKKIDYKQEAIEYLTEKLLDWLSFDILREKMGLIYDFSTFSIGSLSYEYRMNGYKFVTEKEKIKKTLEEFFNVLHKSSFEFLKTERGKEWFDDVISTYIFPRTVKFNEELAENGVVSLLEDAEIFNNNVAVKEAKKIKISDIEEYLKKRIEISPHIWMESDMKVEDMIKIVNDSSFGKYFNKDGRSKRK